MFAVINRQRPIALAELLNFFDSSRLAAPNGSCEVFLKSIIHHGQSSKVKGITT
jgi:hypothetical protein